LQLCDSSTRKTLKENLEHYRDAYPEEGPHLPTILSQEEVTAAHQCSSPPLLRTLLMALYATGLRRAELARLKVVTSTASAW